MKTSLLFCCLTLTLLSPASHAADSPTRLAKLEPNQPAVGATAQTPWQALNPKKLQLKSASALVLDDEGNDVYTKAINEPVPIASITKLMTAMVILDGKLDMNEKIVITKDDRDLIQLTGSRLNYGATLKRKEMQQLA